MGEFDYVNAKIKCNFCDKVLNDWQTKKNCDYGTIPFGATTNFYTNCPACKKWNQYELSEDGQNKRNILLAAQMNIDDFDFVDKNEEEQK